MLLKPFKYWVVLVETRLHYRVFVMKFNNL